MLISRTPLRISFFGGGTDYPAYYEEHGGTVLSTSINKYSYIICRYTPPFFDYNYVVQYSIHEETKSISEIKHPSARECLNFLNFDHGTAILHNADLPAMSGLGSSSAFTVGLLNALHALTGKMTTKRQLALEAIHVEQDMIKENVGSQDQTTTAFGGFNKIDFGGPQKITITPVTIEQDKIDTLQNYLMLFFIGFPRMSSDIASEQIKNIPLIKKELRSMTQMTEEAISILNSNQDSLTDFGKLLHETWQIKRSLTSHITNPFIDEVYEAAMTVGALGGKLLGAGGGGFMLFFAEPELQPKLKVTLAKLLWVPFKFEYLGSQIIYNAPEHNY